MIGRFILVVLAVSFAFASLIVLGSNSDVPSRCSPGLWRWVSVIASTACGLEVLDCIRLAWRWRRG